MGSSGQFNLLVGDCNAVRNNTQRITEIMFLPFVQGVLQYAYLIEQRDNGERFKAEGAVFAAAVLPILHDCSPEAAQIVYDNMGVGAPSTDYLAVRSALESNYDCMGIKCADIGGLYNAPMAAYYQYAGACDDNAIVVIPSTGGFNMMIVYIAAPV